jgi:transposase InsO family protein
METDFCVEALAEALGKGRPEIFNTDQGSQFTSDAFTGMLLEHGIQVSMDGKGRYNLSPQHEERRELARLVSPTCGVTRSLSD